MPAYPVVGHIPAYLRDRLGLFSQLAEGARTVPCRLVGRSLLLNDPEDIRHVLATHHANYLKARRLVGVRAAWRGGSGLLTSTGSEHQRKRRTLQPVFREALVDLLVARSRDNADRLVAGWRPGGEVDVAASMMALAQRSVLETMFGPSSEEWLGLLTEANRARRRFIESVYFSLFPLPELRPTRVNLAYALAMRRVDPGIYRAIAARRRSRERHDDMLSMLMEATDRDGRRLDDRELRDEILTFALTGHETVGESLAWTLFLLAADPVADAAVVRDLGAGDSSYALRAVRESLRLFPPTWIYARVARDDDVLPSGARVRRGTMVYLSPYVLHRNPRFWPEPERFLPDRFLPDAVRARPRYAYLPFGSGPHVCIGESLALAQILAVLERVLEGFRLVAPAGLEVVPEAGLTLRPTGLRLRVEARG
ncbi:MAG: hypothetical protein QOE36_1321 [Gaiellaceae bacterium]|nr:hypothetical protein [Gaiellaceae bacterium]